MHHNYLISYSFNISVSDEITKEPIEATMWCTFIVEGSENTLVTFLKSMINAGYDNIEVYLR